MAQCVEINAVFIEQLTRQFANCLRGGHAEQREQHRRQVEVTARKMP